MQRDYKYKISIIVLAGLLIFSGVAYAAAQDLFTGQVNANAINVRLDATIGAQVVCTLAKGQLVEVVLEAYDWYKIRLPKTAPSYIKKNLVKCIDVVSVDNPAKCLNAKVIADRVNIRFGPTESSWILGKVDKLTVVNILAEEGSWYKIEPVYQSYGWVNKKFVDKYPVLPKQEEKLVAPVKDIKLGDNLVIEGMVSPYGVVLWRTATHKLITANNKTYLLKGNRKGLDSLNYHGVKVTGKLISPAKSKYPIIQAAIIEALN